jgi:hypothetical protein
LATVYVSPGTYIMNETLVFEAQDSIIFYLLSPVNGQGHGTATGRISYL